MSTEMIAILVAIAAVVVTSAVEVGYLIHMTRKMNADDAAICLQGRKVEEILRQMREGAA